jgi:CHAT domain-containing protein/Tfp pilus assembly protein PilF
MNFRNPFGASFLHLFILKKTVFSLFFLSLCLLSSAFAQKPDTLRPLETNRFIAGEITGDAIHRYQIYLNAQQRLSLVIEQLGGDLSIEMIGPEGNKITSHSHGEVFVKTLALTAETSGDYRLEVRLNKPQPTSVKYTLMCQLFNDPMPVTADEGERLYKEGYALWLKGTADSFREALNKFTQALSLYELAANRQEQAGMLSMMGNIHNVLGDARRALDYHKSALQIRRELNDGLGQMMSANNIAGIYSTLGDLQKALEYQSQSLALSQRDGNDRGQAITLNNIALIFNTLGDRQRALIYLEQAHELIKNSWDKNAVVGTLINLGAIYEALGDNQKALDFYNQSLAIPTSSTNRKQPITQHHIGHIYEKLGNREQALGYYQQALSGAKNISDLPTEALTLNSLGKFYAATGEPQKALDYCRQALALNQKMSDKSGEATVLYDLARIERDQNNLPVAKELIETSLQIVESVRAKVEVQEFRASYFASVQDYYELYIDVLMRLQNQDGSKSYSASAFQANERRLARGLLESLVETRAGIRQGVDEQLLERESFLQQKYNASSRLLLRLLNSKPTAEESAKAKRETEAYRRQLIETQAKIRETSPRYAALIQPQLFSLVEIQKEVVDADTLLLEYALGNERSYLFAVTQKDLTVYELPGRKKIENAAQRLSGLLTTRNQVVEFETVSERHIRIAKAEIDLPEVAAELSQLLLAPVASRLTNQRLVVVSDGALQYVPFAVLPKPNLEINKPQALTPLISAHEIVNLPSASTLAVLRNELQGRKPAAKILAVIADPVFDKSDERLKLVQAKRVKETPEIIARIRVASQTRSQSPPQNAAEQTPAVANHFTRALREAEISDDNLTLARLPYTRKEAASIIALVPAPLRKAAIDFSANRALAMSRELSEFRFIHFATHGFLNTTHPELSGIVLSMVDEEGKEVNGMLRAQDIYNLKLPAELVTLSGCRTGLGKEIRGEGLVGLTRGFMYAGAARVLVSLWDVNDEATAELMSKFYSAMIKEKLTPAAALKTAQARMAKDKRWSSPYYWAAFILQGEPK